MDELYRFQFVLLSPYVLDMFRMSSGELDRRQLFTKTLLDFAQWRGYGRAACMVQHTAAPQANPHGMRLAYRCRSGPIPHGSSIPEVEPEGISYGGSRRNHAAID